MALISFEDMMAAAPTGAELLGKSIFTRCQYCDQWTFCRPCGAKKLCYLDMRANPMGLKNDVLDRNKMRATMEELKQLYPCIDKHTRDVLGNHEGKRVLNETVYLPLACIDPEKRPGLSKFTKPLTILYGPSGKEYCHMQL